MIQAICQISKALVLLGFSAYLKEYEPDRCASGDKVPAGGGDWQKCMTDEDEKDQCENGNGRPGDVVQDFLEGCNFQFPSRPRAWMLITFIISPSARRARETTRYGLIRPYGHVFAPSC